MKSTLKKLTYEDYVCYPDDGKRHEIIDGEHFINPAPSTYHQEVSRRIQFQLYTQIELEKLGAVIDAPVDVQLSPHDIVQPDLVIVLTDNRIVTPTKVKGSPEHVIEILSPSTEQNDRKLKFDLYQRSGIGEYWIVDPAEQTIEQFVLTDSKYVPREHNDHISVSYLPDVSVDLNQVW
ncbi:MAG: Uma2 family endonuclease [Aureliella sp.]